MNKFATTIAALAALSTASFAEGNHDLDAIGGAMIGSQTVYADEETSSDGMSSAETFESESGRDGHSGRGGARI